MKILCDILDENNVEYNWYVLGKAFTEEVDKKIKGFFSNNDKVKFIGYKDNVYPYIKKMDYLALLSDRESWGLVISEALILGVPCIVTNFEGVSEQIGNLENGIILDMTNENNSYESRVNDILKLKTILKENVAKEDYNRDNIINRWISLLNK